MFFVTVQFTKPGAKSGPHPGITVGVGKAIETPVSAKCKYVTVVLLNAKSQQILTEWEIDRRGGSDQSIIITEEGCV